jgi:hypothetical protein
MHKLIVIGIDAASAAVMAGRLSKGTPRSIARARFVERSAQAVWLRPTFSILWGAAHRALVCRSVSISLR